MTTDYQTNGLLVFPRRDSSFGYLRTASNSYAPSNNDVYVPAQMVNQFKLRPADRLVGVWKEPTGKDRDRVLAELKTVNDKPPEEAKNRPYFDDLTPIYPDRPMLLEHNSKEITSRIVDLVVPLGFGQRALIVAPPKAGKTSFLHNIAGAIQTVHPKATLIALLIDERPEEVTDFKARIKSGLVIASTFDEEPERHLEVAQVVVERARRLAEMKGDVVILMDSITRLARAYNTMAPSGGKTLSGGLDARAMVGPKKIFGAARALREGGSITIIGTALVDTGSKMDEVIYEEFKGTGNSEIHLDRRLMERRIFPCMDIAKSGTRREELLQDTITKERMWDVRRVLSRADTVGAMEAFKAQLEKTRTNAEYIMSLAAHRK